MSLGVRSYCTDDLWWHGPEWLKLIESTWPSWNAPDLTPEALLLDSDRQKSNVIYDVTNVVRHVHSVISITIDI